ncbi:MAG: hypothetical protein HY653_03875, partial [Acidobacteria bacterium]|nr:hypothetical protein [Acidobacteriota bacterium]
MAQLYPYQRAWVDDESLYKLACKARQIGFTFAATFRAVLRRLKRPGLTVWLSASERQAVEALEQVRRHVSALGVGASFYSEFIAGTDVQQHRISFSNGSRIIALPANPDTVRGFSGDVVLDEFAFHRDSHAIWRAAFATATRGFQLEVISTPNGTQGKYYELARQAGLVRAATGETPFDSAQGGPVPPRQQQVWSAHWCDIHTARALGFDVDITSLRAAVDDEDTWQQEYCCQFLSDAAHYLPLELVVAAEYASPALAATPSHLSAGHHFSGAESEDDGSGRVAPLSGAGGIGHCYLGVDIGRKHDKTVLWLLEEADGILWTRHVQTLDRQPFAQQRAAIESLL